jgi:hypothetical protein
MSREKNADWNNNKKVCRREIFIEYKNNASVSYVLFFWGSILSYIILINWYDIHLKCRKKKSKTGRLKLDHTKLSDENLLVKFQTGLAKHRENTRKDNKKLSVNGKFAKLTDYVRQHGNDHFGKD